MSNEYPSDSRVPQKKPSESAFKQQKLPAWQPILTAGTVLPTFFVIGIAFIPIGIVIVYFNQGVQERVFNYTDCLSVDDPSKQCSEIIGPYRNGSCDCSVEAHLENAFEGEVFLYYGLTNFYQNHRRYVKSRDDVQLLGQLSQSPSSDCAPYMYDSDLGSKKAIAPCGAIANSMFSDVLSLVTETGEEVPLLRTGIAWPSDKDTKFRNPIQAKNLDELRNAFKDYAKPKDWQQEIWELDEKNLDNNGFQNEDFIVWMRTAALPNFRKLYRRVDHSVEKYKNGLPAGHYKLKVKYKYPVTPFKGTKSLIISTTSILGAKNPFLGYAYIVVGCLCLLVGVLFLVIHIKYGKSTAEVVNVTPTTSYQ